MKYKTEEKRIDYLLDYIDTDGFSSFLWDLLKAIQEKLVDCDMCEADHAFIPKWEDAHSTIQELKTRMMKGN